MTAMLEVTGVWSMLRQLFSPNRKLDVQRAVQSLNDAAVSLERTTEKFKQATVELEKNDDPLATLVYGVKGSRLRRDTRRPLD